MYRNIDCKFWTDPKVRKLDYRAKFLFLYLVTNPHAHFSGFYYLPLVTISHETGIPLKDLRYPIDTLSAGYLCQFDRASEVVFVVNMLTYQASGAKARAGALEHAKQFSHSSLYPVFCDRYGFVADTPSIPYRYPIGGVSSQDTGYRNQEQEQEQEEYKRGAVEADNSTPAVFTLPALRNDYPVTQAQVAEWSELFPAVDVPAELRKMIGWLKANPAKRKTLKGVPRFINAWLSSQQDKGGTRASPPVTSPRHVSREQTHEEFLASLPPGMRERTIAAEKAMLEQEEKPCAH